MTWPGDQEPLNGGLEAVEGRFILTINDVPQIRDLYAGDRFSIEPVGVTCRVSGATTDARELIITGAEK